MLAYRPEDTASAPIPIPTPAPAAPLSFRHSSFNMRHFLHASCPFVYNCEERTTCGGSVPFTATLYITGRISISSAITNHSIQYSPLSSADDTGRRRGRPAFPAPRETRGNGLAVNLSRSCCCAAGPDEACAGSPPFLRLHESSLVWLRRWSGAGSAAGDPVVAVEGPPWSSVDGERRGPSELSTISRTGGGVEGRGEDDVDAGGRQKPERAMWRKRRRYVGCSSRPGRLHTKVSKGPLQVQVAQGFALELEECRCRCEGQLEAKD